MKSINFSLASRSLSCYLFMCVVYFVVLLVFVLFLFCSDSGWPGWNLYLLYVSSELLWLLMCFVFVVVLLRLCQQQCICAYKALATPYSVFKNKKNISNPRTQYKNKHLNSSLANQSPSCFFDSLLFSFYVFMSFEFDSSWPGWICLRYCPINFSGVSCFCYTCLWCC